MWWSFAKVSLRALYRDRLYTLVNVTGLSVGLACCLVLGLYVHSQLTFDLHNEKHAQIYRVAVEYAIDGRSAPMAMSSPLLGPVLAQDYPGFSNYVRFRPISIGEQSTEQLVRHEDKSHYWEDVFFADQSVFDVFTHTILSGDPRTALNHPEAVAVSRTFAERYFGTTEAVGKIVTLDDNTPREITLVFEDLPQNSHLRYDVLLTYPPLDMAQSDPRDFWQSSEYTYLLLENGVNPASFREIPDRIFDRYMSEHGSYLNGHWTAWLQPLREVHMRSGLANDKPTGNKNYVFGASVVAVLILAIACINYVNLSTARATRRAHEVGMRKILGASRVSLAIQFQVESILLALVAMIVALFIMVLSTEITGIDQTLGISLLPYLQSVPFAYLWMALASLLVGVIGGLYPVYYLSSIAPVSALVSSKQGTGATSLLRELLVLLQFAISIGVIGATIVMQAQMQYLANKPLGFEKDGRLVVPLQGADVVESLPALANELSQNERILSITASDRLVGGSENSTFLEIENLEGRSENVMTQLMPVARNFLPAMGIDIIEGRNFSPSDAPAASIIVNEAVVRRMNWEEPIGKRIGVRGRVVIGVARDFSFDSLHAPVEPMAIYPYRTDFSGLAPQRRPYVQRQMILHLESESLGDTLKIIESTMRRFDTLHPFRFEFLDSVIQRQYTSEQRLITLLTAFAAICGLLACLGQFGLMAYTTEARTKEIGIRTILGASAFQILALLFKRLLMIALLAGFIAIPISYLVVDSWLSTFSYRIRADIADFVIATAMMIGVSAATVTAQSLGVMRREPVEALRYE